MGANAAVANVYMDKPRSSAVKWRVETCPVEVDTFNKLSRSVKADFGDCDVRRRAQYMLTEHRQLRRYASGNGFWFWK